ncbi:hypothetical protein [Staphylococcus epidermidis]|uniref:hypothetical protein n=1 Tax=Staphylococcus epidermidis TaxID=1282 RepID=UPI0011AA93F8
MSVKYEGGKKFKRIVGKDGFIGCNRKVIGGVRVGNDSVIGGGWRIRDNMREDSLGLGGGREVNKEG